MPFPSSFMKLDFKDKKFAYVLRMWVDTSVSVQHTPVCFNLSFHNSTVHRSSSDESFFSLSIVEEDISMVIDCRDVNR